MSDTNRRPIETLDESEDDGTMPASREALSDALIGRRIIQAKLDPNRRLVLKLDDDSTAVVVGKGDCCAYTKVEAFWLDPTAVDHMILGVSTTDRYQTWHIYADFGDVMALSVGWDAGTGYYGYGFDVTVEPPPETKGAR